VFYLQDLLRLGRPIKDVIIIDNSPASYAFQPENAVPIESWFDDPQDLQLMELMGLLNELAKVKPNKTNKTNKTKKTKKTKTELFISLLGFFFYLVLI
jgi:TFIIF-interacting CTD phosphatase-like protein